MSAPAHTIALVPQCSLTPAQARLFFGSICAGSFLVAGLVASQGFWPVLPFAGLEMAGLGLALKLSLDRRHCVQTILITEDRVQVQTTRKGRLLSQFVFARHWSRVRLRPATVSHHPSRLFIESSGRACEIGPFLTDDERKGVSRQLQQWIGRVSETPPLGAD